jgi:tellurite resistance protein TehA-like permease
MLVAVAAALVALAVSDRATLRESACVPGALTWVAGTDVVGSRLGILGWQHEAAALLIVAAALWLVLVPCVLAHWRVPTVGLSFLLVVATESLAVLGARLGLGREALVPFALGLVFYIAVLVRFDVRQLLEGRGDHWIAGGALAIAALAGARCAQRVGGLHDATLAVWAAAAAWLPVLVACEAARLRRGFDERRWSTVFPLGMYAACSFVAGRAAGVPAPKDFARVWVWVAVAVWGLTAAGTLRAPEVRSSLKPSPTQQ